MTILLLCVVLGPALGQAQTSLTLRVSSGHGTPEPRPGTHRIAAGSTVTAAVAGSPESDTTGTTRWVAVGWKGTGSAPAAGFTTQTQFRMEKDSGIQWLWMPQFRLDAEAFPPQGGCVAQRDASTPADGTWYNRGRTIYVRPHPNRGWAFAGWGGDASDSGAGSSATLVFNRPLKVSARFNQIPGVVRQPLSQGINAGAAAVIDLVCTGSAPLSFAWQKDGTALRDGGRVSGAATAALHIADFNTSDTGTYQCRVSNAAGEAMSAPVRIRLNRRLEIVSAQGSPNPLQGTHWFPAGTEMTALLNPDVISANEGKTRHVCIGWTIEGSALTTGTGRRAPVILDRDSTVTWHWRTEHLWETQSNPTAGGSILPAPGWIEEGSVIYPLALPARDFVFARWSGGLAGTGAFTTVTMNGPRRVTAEFIPGMGTVRITVSPATAGWTLTDCHQTSRDGTGCAVLEGIPCGPVTVAWRTPPDCYAPAVNPVTRWLGSEADLNFVQVFTSSALRSRNLQDRILTCLLGVGSSGTGLDLNGDEVVDAADLARAVALAPAGEPGWPSPADGATNIFPGTVFNWENCLRAQTYKVFLWQDDKPKPAAPIVRDLPTSRFHPLTPLRPGKVYRWQVIAVNENQPTTGPVWTFTTRP